MESAVSERKYNRQTVDQFEKAALEMKSMPSVEEEEKNIVQRRDIT